MQETPFFTDAESSEDMKRFFKFENYKITKVVAMFVLFGFFDNIREGVSNELNKLNEEHLTPDWLWKHIAIPCWSIGLLVSKTTPFSVLNLNQGKNGVMAGATLVKAIQWEFRSKRNMMSILVACRMIREYVKLINQRSRLVLFDLFKHNETNRKVSTRVALATTMKEKNVDEKQAKELLEDSMFIPDIPFLPRDPLLWQKIREDDAIEMQICVAPLSKASYIQSDVDLKKIELKYDIHSRNNYLKLGDYFELFLRVLPFAFVDLPFWPPQASHQAQPMTNAQLQAQLVNSTRNFRKNFGGVSQMFKIKKIFNIKEGSELDQRLGQNEPENQFDLPSCLKVTEHVAELIGSREMSSSLRDSISFRNFLMMELSVMQADLNDRNFVAKIDSLGQTTSKSQIKKSGRKSNSSSMSPSSSPQKKPPPSEQDESSPQKKPAAEENEPAAAPEESQEDTGAP